MVLYKKSNYIFVMNEARGVEKDAQGGAEWPVLLTQYYSGDKIEMNEMGGSCSAYGGEERRVQGFGGETWGKETTGETQA